MKGKEEKIREKKYVSVEEEGGRYGRRGKENVAGGKEKDIQTLRRRQKIHKREKVEELIKAQSGRERKLVAFPN